MEKIIFENLPSTNTPINAENLNQIQTNVESAINNNTDMLVGNTPAGNMIVNSIRSKNIASDTTIKKGLWASGNKIATNNTGWYVVVPITAGETYTISRKYTGSLYATTTSTYPANDVSQVDSWTGGENSKQLTISTSGSAKYLFLGLLGGSSPTEQQKSQAVEELMVEAGSTATAYSPYQNLNGEENYTTEEIRIGTWIDGKPLYRKVFTGTTTNDMISSSQIIANFSTTFVPVKTNGYISNYTNNGSFMQIGQYYGANDYTYYIINPGQIKVKVSLDAYVGRNIIFIMEYTKTTD